MECSWEVQGSVRKRLSCLVCSQVLQVLLVLEGKSLESQSEILWLSLDHSQLVCTVLHYWAPG